MAKYNVFGEIIVAFGDASWSSRYRVEDLSRADRARAHAPRAPRADQDWRVSRALAAWLRGQAGVAADAPVSLSHSRAHALVAHGPPGLALGVDLERCAPRDVPALASWVCTDAERRMLHEARDPAARLERFYLLWTLKEALVKAAGLEFPADMALVGLDTPTESGGHVRLRAPQGLWRAATWRLPGDWVASAAWRFACAAAMSTVAEPRWVGSPTPVRVLGAWSSIQPG